MAKKGAKNKDTQESSKSLKKKDDKTVDDKTFGLKNKNKSKKVQSYIKQVQEQVHNKGTKGPIKSEAAMLAEKKELKRKDREKAALLAHLMKGVTEKAKIGKCIC